MIISLFPRKKHIYVSLKSNNIKKLMNSLNKSRFLLSVLLLSTITAIVFTNLEASSQFFSSTQLAISESMGWFIILTANGFLVFSTYLIFTRYKNIKLGGLNAVPAYSYSNWIAMLFSAGLGIGLLFYGVAEPIGNLNDYPEMTDAIFRITLVKQ